MESIGQALKSARERRQITIDDIVAATKMSSSYVKAIEANNFAVFGASVYARGFIKLYAGCVGLDSSHLLRQFGADSRAAFEPAAALSRAKQARTQVKTSPAKTPDATTAKTKPVRETASFQAPAMVKTGLTQGWPSSPPVAAISGWRSKLSFLGAWRLPTWNLSFFSRIQWPRFVKPLELLERARLPRIAVLKSVFRPIHLPLLAWRRIFILAFLAMLAIAAGMAWEWSLRGMPVLTDACRWLAEPPAPYLTADMLPPSPGR